LAVYIGTTGRREGFIGLVIGREEAGAVARYSEVLGATGVYTGYTGANRELSEGRGVL
jgi:hypothetical protein